MTNTVVVMIVIGLILIILSYIISEKVTRKQEDFQVDLLTVKDDYDFSERELRIIKSKIEDVIADQAKEILYQTNESLANMANEKTMALGDYAVTVCDEIERNHKEVMFLYSMLDDKQKEILKTVQSVEQVRKDLKESAIKLQVEENLRKDAVVKEVNTKKVSAIDQLTALKQKKEQIDMTDASQANLDRKSTVHEEKDRPNEEIQDSKQDEEQNQIDIVKAADIEKEVTLEKEIQEIHQVQTVAEEIVDNEMDDSFEEDLSALEDVFSEVDQAEFEEEYKENSNSNDIILQMYRNGNNIISIAKELGLGVGEVKLVIDLYQGA